MLLPLPIKIRIILYTWISYLIDHALTNYLDLIIMLLWENRLLVMFLFRLFAQNLITRDVIALNDLTWLVLFYIVSLLIWFY